MRKGLLWALMLAFLLSLAACSNADSTNPGETPGTDIEIDNGGSTSADDDSDPNDGDNFIDFGGTDPDNGGTAPDDSTTPDNSGTTPSNSGTTPDDGDSIPNDSETTPDNSGTAPDNGGADPDNGDTAPDDTGPVPDDSGDNAETAPQTYKLTLESEGEFGTRVIEIKYGDPLNLPTPTRSGEYTFLYWEDKATGQPVTATEYLFTSDRTFIAVWQQTWTPDY